MAKRLPLILLATLLAGTAGAAELGEARVTSYIGQQLVADIDLTLLDAPGTPVQVRLARPDVYRGANIGMPKVLSTLSMTVMQREGRQFLHVTSLAPVESNYLHLYLELVDGGQSSVRLATLWLTPDPNPAPPPVPAPVPVPVPAPVSVPPAPLPVAAPVVAQIAEPKPKPAPSRVVTVRPPKPPTPAPERKPAPVSDKTPAARPEPVAAPAAAPKAEAPPLPVAAGAAPATCATASAAAPAEVCVALDVKNAQLRDQIGVLEDKVKVLQVALGASPATVSKPAPAAHPRPYPAHKRPAPQPEQESGAPWGWIAAGIGVVLAIAGGALVLVRRRRGAGVPAAPSSPLMARLRQRFGRKKTTAEPAEPKLDSPDQEMSTQV